MAAEFQLKLQDGHFKSFSTETGERFDVVRAGLPFELASASWERVWTCVSASDPSKQHRRFWYRGDKWVPVVTEEVVASSAAAAAAAAEATSPPHSPARASASAAVVAADEKLKKRPKSTVSARGYPRNRTAAEQKMSRVKASIYHDPNLRLTSVFGHDKDADRRREAKPSRIRVRVRSMLLNVDTLLHTAMKYGDVDGRLKFKQATEEQLLKGYNLRDFDPSFLLGMVAGASIMLPPKVLRAMRSSDHSAYGAGAAFDPAEKELGKRVLGHLKQASIHANPAASATVAAAAAAAAAPAPASASS